MLTLARLWLVCVWGSVPEVAIILEPLEEPRVRISINGRANSHTDNFHER